MYEVLYRKHRPKSFDDVVGQEQVTLPLRKALEKSAFAHAYVFAGPRGTGKTSTARILAKHLNCLAEEKPCGRCESCLSIDHSSYMDVVELDAASYRGIDEIRKIRDGAGYRPVMGKTKVYIIDEFHMLTREAFNALLKTLEEPPQGTVFVLATTNLEKVPDTVISRCQVFQFRPLSDEDIEVYLTEIAKKEAIRHSSEALKQISRHARGSMRDAVNVLERVASVAEEISLEDVHKILGLVPEESVKEYLDSIRDGNYGAIADISATIARYGLSYDQLLAQALDLVKAQLIDGEMSLKDGVSIGTMLWEILQELRVAMDKKSVFEVLSIIKMQRAEDLQIASAERGKTPEKQRAPSEKPLAEDSVGSKGSTFSDYVEVLYRKGQVLLWSTLKMAEVDEQEDNVTISYGTEEHFSSTLFAEQRDLIEADVLKELGKRVVVEKSGKKHEENLVQGKVRDREDILKSLRQDQREYVERIVRLFGDDVELSVDADEEEQA